MMPKATVAGVYSATYSNVCKFPGLSHLQGLLLMTREIPVYEYQFGEGLKEHGETS